MGVLAGEPYHLPGTGGPGGISLRSVPIGSGRERRNLIVAIPPPGIAGQFPVMYLHDGQNLFDPATSHAGDWGLVATLNDLTAQGIAAIVVGIPNRGRRRKYDYNPFRDFWFGRGGWGRGSGGGGGDRYLRFLREDVKPLIDHSFPTRAEPEHTVIAGSSLGGLISLYAVCRHGDVFGAAGVLSPALWVSRRAIYRFVRNHPPPSTCRVYLDVGTGEGAEQVQDVRELRDLLRERRDRAPHLSYIEDAGGEHNEAAWGRRFRAAARFLVGRPGTE